VVAVKVVEFPEQMGFCEKLTLTVGHCPQSPKLTPEKKNSKKKVLIFFIL
jgi:hypothetical protein